MRIIGAFLAAALMASCVHPAVKMVLNNRTGHDVRITTSLNDPGIPNPPSSEVPSGSGLIVEHYDLRNLDRIEYSFNGKSCVLDKDLIEARAYRKYGRDNIDLGGDDATCGTPGP
jgi:hypothetical protein